ncbi:flagellar hook protein FlgE [Extensimonas sp. H3M7-6]|uniref:flagellar hook protein FlgE n=1 Tax=Extensimonas soli TaxID=3031322 RepID=UPI0023D9AAF9|nr:flagellar hook protein FlgE [Extensimonas sp. H3M7-6]MDF1482792.1 flagellar hook protein FlgE [Extensimonas sp. H3M7-6]
MAFQQGLSGLNAASKSLDVIGNNIANANTTGFKSSRAEFADMVASAMGVAGGSDAGIGVQVADIAQQFTRGNISTTGNNLDVAIDGGGFFKLQQADGSMAYTRAGNFQLDKVGNLVTNNNAKVLGYTVDPTTGKPVSGASPVPLVFPTSAPIAAKQTSKIMVGLNLDARAPDAAGDPAATPPIPATPRTTYSTSINVYDSQGVAKPVNLYFQKNGANTWDVYDQLDDATATPPVVATPIGQVTFDNNGAILAPAPVAPSTEHLLSLTVNPSPPNPNALPAFPVSINLDKVTQYGSSFAVSTLSQDGYASGELTSVNIENSGMVMATYSNGVTRAEAQLALANFRNPQGLRPTGGNNWVETFESGAPVVGAPGTGSLGALRSGSLEDSNVDLTAELVNLMTAQRYYQANAQTIKTEDQVMSTLVNLR